MEPHTAAPRMEHPPRADRDLYRLAPSMDPDAVEAMVNCLEFRATDSAYTRMSQAYFARLPVASASQILALGCGTGVEVRTLNRTTSTAAKIIGLDHSPALIEVASQRTADEGLSENMVSLVGEAHHLPLPDEDFDIVIMHTLLSELDDANSQVYANIGTGSFWANVPAVYAPILLRFQLLPATVIKDWLSCLTAAIERRTFFGAANVFTDIARRSSDGWPSIVIAAVDLHSPLNHPWLRAIGIRINAPVALMTATLRSGTS